MRHPAAELSHKKLPPLQPAGEVAEALALPDC
jgi:hypothetical protein